jgi:hypothetical protein
MCDCYSTAYNMWKGFPHCSSFLMMRQELLGMHIRTYTFRNATPKHRTFKCGSSGVLSVCRMEIFRQGNSFPMATTRPTRSGTDAWSKVCSSPILSKKIKTCWVLCSLFHPEESGGALATSLTSRGSHHCFVIS